MGVEGLIPPTPKRSVAVVADTAWALDSKTTFKEANLAIPFFGLLMGVVSIGHAVWIFGSSPDLKVGCRDADVLIVDGPCLAALPKDWRNIASMAKKNPEIFVHDRAQLPANLFHSRGFRFAWFGNACFLCHFPLPCKSK